MYMKLIVIGFSMCFVCGAPPVFSQSLEEVDVYSRESVVNYYNDVYAVPSVDPMWTGSVDDCVSGSVSAEYIDSTKERVNYFRAMAGVPPILYMHQIGFDSPQDAALMMSANRALSHYPEVTWPCYTQNGYFAATRSNLAYGSSGPDAIDQYIEDAGDNNAAVGHRRWILYPPILEMNTGDIPGSSGVLATNALQVIGGERNSQATSREPFVAWPNPGHVPSALVPPRWSFSHESADFTDASIKFYKDGQIIGKTIEPLDSGAGLDSIVWVSSDAPDSGKDTLFSVLLEDVRVEGELTQFQYETVAVQTGESAIHSSADADNDDVYTGEFLDVETGVASFYWHVSPDSPLAQSFTHKTPGVLTGVNVPLTCSDPDSNIVLELRDVVNNKPGSVIYTSIGRSASALNSSSSSQWEHFTFDTPVSLAVGSQYAVVLQSTAQCGWYAADTNYSGGNGYFAALTFAGLLDSDLGLETIVLPDQIDNCPTTSNPDQLDSDSDGLGDACDLELSMETNKWYMMSLPASPPSDANTVADIIGDDLADESEWALFEFIVETGGYDVLDTTSAMKVGSGYWIIQDTGETVNIDMPVGSRDVPYEPTMRCSNALNCSPQRLTAIEDRDAWNMIGPTTQVPVSTEQLRLAAISGPCSDLDACKFSDVDTAAIDLMWSNMWSYNGSQYELVSGEDGQLEPWKAYWSMVFASAFGLEPTLWVPH